MSKYSIGMCIYFAGILTKCFRIDKNNCNIKKKIWAERIFSDNHNICYYGMQVYISILYKYIFSLAVSLSHCICVECRPCVLCIVYCVPCVLCSNFNNNTTTLFLRSSFIDHRGINGDLLL